MYFTSAVFGTVFAVSPIPLLLHKKRKMPLHVFSIKSSQTTRMLLVQSCFMYWKVNKWEHLISTNNTISAYDLSNTQAKQVQDPVDLNEEGKNINSTPHTTWCHKIGPQMLWTTAAFQGYYPFPAVGIVHWVVQKRNWDRGLTVFKKEYHSEKITSNSNGRHLQLHHLTSISQFSHFIRMFTHTVQRNILMYCDHIGVLK